MTKAVIGQKKRKNQSPCFKAKVAREAIRDEVTFAEFSKNTV
ncbi:MAG: hypothetical protein ABJL67_09930 [Sulfitobacter sp.]